MDLITKLKLTAHMNYFGKTARLNCDEAEVEGLFYIFANNIYFAEGVDVEALERKADENMKILKELLLNQRNK